MDLSAPLEDYLEAILVLCQSHQVARVKDIAGHLGVTNPSVVGALRALKAKKLLQQERYGYVQLTTSGSQLASEVHARHLGLTKFFENILGLDAQTAAADACKIEHHVSDATMDALNAMAKFVESETAAGRDWLAPFRRRRLRSRRPGTKAWSQKKKR